MNSIDKKKLGDWIAEGPITIPKVYSNNNNTNPEEEEFLVEPWRIMSFYKSDDLNFYYYLYPELVNKNNSGKETTYLCPRCYKSYENDTYYKLSIAAGIDFGNFRRINGLIKPNLHEQIILSLNRLYSVRIKVMPNGKGFMQTHGMNKMRGNQILFHHDCITKVNHEVLQESDYENDINMYLYGDKNELDNMAKIAYGKCKLYAQRKILKQWFTILKRTNLYFNKFEENLVHNIISKVEKVVKRKKENPIFISDKESLNYEKGLGSDVAAVQQVDASTSFYYYDNSNNTCLDECNNESNDELPLRSHFVCYTPESILENKKVQDAIQID